MGACNGFRACRTGESEKLTGERCGRIHCAPSSRRGCDTYDPPVNGVEDFGLVREEKPETPELARCWRQREPAHKLINFKNIPTLLMSAEASFGAPTAHCNAAFLKQAGVPVDFIRLADISIRGNGHFLMLEKNNLDIAAVIADWLDKRVTPNETTAGEKMAR